jgi:hypothetical protein
MKFNKELIEQAIQPESQTILAVDCSFIPKSGKQTYGLDRFYNGSAAKTEKGLEISAMAVVDVTNNISYHLSVQQTPATEEITTISNHQKIDIAQITRINYYLAQLEATRPYLPHELRYVVTDGFYSKIKWVL